MSLLYVAWKKADISRCHHWFPSEKSAISALVPLTSFRRETSGGATYKISAVFSGNYPTLRATDKPYDNTKPPTNYVRYLVRKQTFFLYSFKKFPQVTVWPL